VCVCVCVCIYIYTNRIEKIEDNRDSVVYTYVYERRTIETAMCICMCMAARIIETALCICMCMALLSLLPYSYVYMCVYGDSFVFLHNGLNVRTYTHTIIEGSP
jgi:hypothetical protein